MGELRCTCPGWNIRSHTFPGEPTMQVLSQNKKHNTRIKCKFLASYAITYRWIFTLNVTFYYIPGVAFHNYIHRAGLICMKLLVPGMYKSPGGLPETDDTLPCSFLMVLYCHVSCNFWKGVYACITCNTFTLLKNGIHTLYTIRRVSVTYVVNRTSKWYMLSLETKYVPYSAYPAALLTHR